MLLNRNSKGFKIIYIIYKTFSKQFFWIFLIFSIWATFATSSEPLIYENNVLSILFSFNFTGKDLLSNLFSGVIVSYIFYFVVVFFPERKLYRENIKQRMLILDPIMQDALQSVAILSNQSLNKAVSNNYPISAIKDLYLPTGIQKLPLSMSRVEYFSRCSHRLNECFYRIIEDGVFKNDKEVEKLIISYIEIFRDNDFMGFLKTIDNKYTILAFKNESLIREKYVPIQAVYDLSRFNVAVVMEMNKYK